MDYQQILQDLDKKIYYPIYLLSGEEPYYIDKIADKIADCVLSDDEKAFNQTIIYGKDTDVQSVSQLAKRFPMMSSYQVVIVKEAQDLKKIEDLHFYAENPLKSTILVLCYKYKKFPGTTKLAKLVKKNGVDYESTALKEWETSKWIKAYVKEFSYQIDDDTATLLAEFLGNSMHKLANEIQKLMILLPKGSAITRKDIERNIGISNEYNNLELTKAFGNKDVLKVQRILQSYAANPKANPIQVTIAALFGYFRKLLILYFLPSKTNEAIAEALKISPNNFVIQQYINAQKRYSATKLVEIIALLRQYDMMSKGVDVGSTSQGDLMRELAFKILH
ncbi:MAG: DNA polymerase III subunit delta [Bacteroidales bacterium]|jgi:DNA polymerase-3 subunit delta|nr:DNA polymerase III subunit delta [Bacteroidales bacterium]